MSADGPLFRLLNIFSRGGNKGTAKRGNMRPNVFYPELSFIKEKTSHTIMREAYTIISTIKVKIKIISIFKMSVRDDLSSCACTGAAFQFYEVEQNLFSAKDSKITRW